MKNSMLKRGVTRLLIPVCSIFLLNGLTSCSDDLLEGQPSWLGGSIYEELERRGNFTETLKLINAQDEDYASVLKKTGSKTLFVADDAAWAKFYQNNPWGVTSIEGMTPAQKKLIFKANMINSAYLVELLGNIPSTSADEPIEGSCMRRATSVNVMDSVPLVTKDQFPVVNLARVDNTTGEQIDFWARLRGKEQVRILEDEEPASMIHFMPKFMQNNNVTSDDVAFLTNGEITSNEGAFVNGQPILESGRDITCQNGYIHQLEGVALPLDNLANVIAQNPQFGIYKRLLDRFSYPTFIQSVNDEYHRQYGGEDSVFVRRYFNEHGNVPFKVMDNGTQVTTLLPYDPGWNRYRLYAQSGATYQNDAAVMLVPTDEALMKYLEGDGADLNDRYGKAGQGETAWDNAPDAVVLPLLKNTMLSSLKAAIPSQFSVINNTAGETMGVEKKDIDQVLWACNGVIYQTNKVYVAPEYVSVYYPCVIRANDDLNITYTTVEKDNQTAGGEGFYAYLNNMGSKYSFVIPTDKALQSYYDPVSYKRTAANGTSTAVAYKFYINESGLISAYPYLVDWKDLDGNGRGRIAEQSTNQVNLSNTFSRMNGDVFNHFADILNSSLSVSLFTPGQKFYEAKNGGPIVVEWEGNTVKGVAGSFQYERGYYVPVTEVFDKVIEGNGRSYIIDDEPLMSTFTSPYAALTDSLNEGHFGSFAHLLSGMDIIATNDGASHVTMDNCLSNLNNYHYTIYVPTNASVDALVESHKLPTWDEVDDAVNCLEVIGGLYDDYLNAGDSVAAEAVAEDYAYLENQIQTMKNVISDFVNYHIQDNSVYVEGEEHSNDVYESACLDTLTSRFVKLYVNYQQGGTLSITDNQGNVRRVDAQCNNILTRQYYFNSASLQGTSAASRIYSSSFAVIHQIDAPLVPFAVSEERPNGSYYNNADYQKVREFVEVKYPVGGDSTPNPIKRRR